MRKKQEFYIAQMTRPVRAASTARQNATPRPRGQHEITANINHSDIQSVGGLMAPVAHTTARLAQPTESLTSVAAEEDSGEELTSDPQHPRDHHRKYKTTGAMVSGAGAAPQADDCFCHLCQISLPSKADHQEHLLLHSSGAPPVGLQRFPTLQPHNLSAPRPPYEPLQPPSDKRPYDPIMGPANGPMYMYDPRPSHSEPEAGPQGDAERRFKCGECGKSYRHAGSLVNHRRCHQTGQYHCSVCGKQYPHLAALHSHLRSHKGRTSAQGSTDWTDYSQGGGAEGGAHFSQDAAHSSLDSLEFHEHFDAPLAQGSQGGRQACADCGQMFDLNALKSHMCSGQQGAQGNGFSMSFSSTLPAADHKHTVKRLGDKEDEDEGEIYQCSVCGNHYASLRALRSHLRSHANNPSFSQLPEQGPSQAPQGSGQSWRLLCSTCGQSFSRKQDLLNHQLIHGPQRAEPKGQRVACADCGLLYDRHLSHMCHGKSRLNGKNAQAEARRPLVEHSDKPHKCDQCGRGYRHPCSLLNHKKSHKTGVFRCLVCQKKYYNLLALKNHQRTHFDLKRHKCEECGKAFKIQKQLLNHLRLHEEHRVKGLVRSGPSGARLSPAGPSQLHTLRAESAKAASLLGFKKPYSSAGTSRPQKFDAVETSRRPFSCEECGKTYRHAGSLANHKNLHKVGDYHCNVCNSTYPNRLAMKNHLRLHFAHKKHNCPDCGKGFRTQRQLATHSTGGLCKGPQGPGQQMDYECDGCCEGFATADDLSAHDCPAAHLPVSSSSTPSHPREERVSVDTDSDERPYVCDLCNCAYKHASSLLNHKHTHKTGNFRCSFCDKPYTNYMALRNHMRIHTQRKKHVCHVCGKAFRLARFLRNHHRVHDEGATPFGCPSCGKSFQGRSALARHRCGDSLDSTLLRRPAPDRKEAEECRYTCEQCGRSYRHPSSLLNHRLSHRVGVFPCVSCSKTFNNALALRTHQRLHCGPRPHRCTDCNKAFRARSQLLNHRHRVHQSAFSPVTALLQERGGASGGRASGGGASGHRLYSCDQCGRSYRHSSSLLNHRRSHMTGAFPCASCHKHFSNLMSLKNHARTHTEPRRHSCPDCGKAFRVSTQLLAHRRVHTHEKPFICSVCDKRFSCKSNLRHHSRLHWGPAAPPVDTGQYLSSGHVHFL
uniref:C2H2-type domain-containing protein n=1 Tax=Knipowitschia caucasica TaxID=637954 RepID=A0AAV2KGY6_KNICA